MTLGGEELAAGLVHALAATKQAARHDDGWYMGPVLELLSSFIGTLGKQAWRLAALNSPGSMWHALRFSSTARLLYVIGLVMTVTEPPLEAISYSLAPLSVISACGGFSIFWNIVLAPCTLGERLTVVRLISGVLIIIGTACVGVAAPHEEVTRTPDQYIELMAQPSAIAYYVFIIAGIATMACVRSHVPATSSGVFNALLAAMIGGNQFLTKIAVELIKCAGDTTYCHGINPFANWHMYVFGGLAILSAGGGLIVLAFTLRDAEALDALTTYAGGQIMIGAISGAAVLQEQNQNSAGAIVLYCLSICLILFALALLGSRERDISMLGIQDRPITWGWYEDIATEVKSKTDELVAQGQSDGAMAPPNKTENSQLLPVQAPPLARRVEKPFDLNFIAAHDPGHELAE